VKVLKNRHFLNMKNIKVLFGRKIKELRKRLGMTQSDLAERVAVDNKHISCIESGKNFPSPDLIDRLGQALHVEPKDLFEFYQNVQESKTACYGSSTGINHHISNFMERTVY